LEEKGGRGTRIEKGLEYDFKIEEEGPVANVVFVDTDFVGVEEFVVVFQRVGLAGEEFVFVAVNEAGGTGEAGFYGEDDAVVAGEFVGITGYVGAGAYKAHLPFQDVPEFGEFVDLGFSQPGAEGGDAGFSLDGDGIAGVAGGHRTELDDGKWAAVETYALLPEQDRSAGGDADEEAGKQQERA
jgi:hypothetical protein